MITISPGHWKPGTGAVGLIDEVTEARRVVERILGKLREMGLRVHQVQDNASKSQAENLRYLINAHNKTARMLDVSVHFNAVSGTHTRAIGTEVLYKNAAVQPLAARLSKAIANAAGFPDRGAKKRNDLAFLNGTEEAAVLIEVCFVNSTVDVARYKQHFETICGAISAALAQHVRPAANPFSSPALYGRVEKLFKNESYVKTLLERGVSQGLFSVIWQEKFENDTLSLTDFCGLCVLLQEERE